VDWNKYLKVSRINSMRFLPQTLKGKVKSITEAMSFRQWDVISFQAHLEVKKSKSIREKT